MGHFASVNPEYQEAVTGFLLAMPVARFYGLDVVELEPGRSELAMPFKADLSHDGRTFQGGVIGALADFAGASAAATLLPKNRVVMTTGFTVHLVALAAGDRLVGIGEVVSAGRSTAVSRADLYTVDERRRVLCATALVTTRDIEPRESRRH